MFDFDEHQKAEIMNLYHLARVALSGQDDSNYQRMLWASKGYSKKYPEISRTVAYKNITRIRNNWF